MKTSLFITKAWLLFVFSLFLTFLTGNEINAAVKVIKKTTSGSVPRSGKGQKDGTPSIYLCTEGWPTLITADSNGNTLVYVNEGGTDFSQSEDCLVQLPEKTHWSQVAFFFGGTEPSAEGNEISHPIKIKMDGGNVGKLFLGGFDRNQTVTGNVDLTITGGSIEYLSVIGRNDAPVKGNVNIIMSDMTYTGATCMELASYLEVIEMEDEEHYDVTIKHYENVSIFINSSCYFNYDSALPEKALYDRDESDYTSVSPMYFMKGAVFPRREEIADHIGDEFSGYYSYRDMMIAVNEAVIPAGMEVTTEYFYVDPHSALRPDYKAPRLSAGSNGQGPRREPQEDDYVNLTTLVNNGTINIVNPRGCSVWDEPTVPFTNNGTINAAGHMQKYFNMEEKWGNHAATCTEPALYEANCQACGGQWTPTHIHTEALGHSVVTIPAIEATCYSEGRTSYQYCFRCKEQITAPETIPTKNHTWESIGTGTRVQGCTVCGKVIDTKNHTIQHEFSSIPYTTISPTCTVPGRNIYKCTASGCNETMIEATDIKHINYRTVKAKEATCTESGYPQYYTCRGCNMKWTSPTQSDQDAFFNISEVEIPAKGHNFFAGYIGYTDGPNSYIMDESTIASPATCTTNQLYYHKCTECGALAETDNYTFGYRDSNLGHDYKFVGFDYISNEVAQEGALSLKCEHCNHELHALHFGLNGVTGIYDDRHPFVGYWYKTELKEITKLPTCSTLGEGIYHLTMSYQDKLLIEKDFTNFIPTEPMRHNYDEDGVCHEQHYLVSVDDDGRPYRDQYGNPSYVVYSNKELVPDENIHTAKAYITECSDVEIESRYEIDVKGNPVYYKLIETTNYDAIGSPFFANVNAALGNENNELVNVSVYQDVEMPVNEAFSDADVLLNTNGHSFTTVITDDEEYSRAMPLRTNSLTYKRTFAESLDGLWQALYVPFPITVTSDLLEQCDVAILSSIEDQDDAHVAILTKYEAGQKTDAATPLFIRPKGVQNFSLTQSDVELLPYNTNNNLSFYTGLYNMYGTYASMVELPTINGDCYTMYNGELHKTTGQIRHANRWYLQSSVISGARLAGGIFVDGEDNSSVIERIEQTSAAASIHAVDGRYVGDDVDGLNAGFYIQDGEKVLIK